jgi:hypothetical protein
MGVPAADCFAVGQLIGVKTVVNEFVAYLQMADMLKNGSPLSYRSVVIASYALSGFANFSSIAIQIGARRRGRDLHDRDDRGHPGRLTCWPWPSASRWLRACRTCPAKRRDISRRRSSRPR